MRIAHLSDLHYSYASWSPLQFFSKRWLGNVNLLLSRKRRYIPNHLRLLPELFKKLQIDSVLICGDLSTTSLEEEFSLAHQFKESIEALNIEVVVIPGNHDQYTKEAFKKGVFYQFFPSSLGGFPEFNLKDHGVACKQLKEGYWLIALDTAIATSLISSEGYFSPRTEIFLEQLLNTIPNHETVLMMNHFPFFPTRCSRKKLIRGKALEELLKRFPQIQFYLHGHTHIQSIADLRTQQLPIVLDSGSVADRYQGSWNLIDLDDSSIEVYQWNECWNRIKKVHYERPLV